jgi:pimeloyl-ACP methyl ester carboxylesterase
MLGKEIKAAGEIAGNVISGPAVLAMEMHKAAAGRAFDALGIIGAPVRLVHDGISGAAYASVRSVLRRLPSRGGAAAARLAPPDATPLAESPLGGIALGALNGAVGDSLKRAHGDLALELSVRHRGRDLPTDRLALAEALPDATSKIVVFVHGLCETDAAWHQLPLSGRTPDRRSYGSRLRDDLGYTPLYVRYNTGLHISDNGQRLSEMLEQLASAWPTHVEEVALIGHSMGGLLSRSACHYAEASDHTWSQHARHVFCLGTPHLGAPLERAANVAGWALDRLPETRPFARLVNGRSVGIKDLRYGSCVEEDWCDCDPDEFLRDRCREVPFLDGATYYFVGATLSLASEGALASIVGDLLVQYPSASGSGPRRRIPFEIENGCHVGRVNHIQLLNHPVVYDQIATWLGRTTTTAFPAQGADAQAQLLTEAPQPL